MNTRIYLQIFLVIYFYTSLVIAAIDAFYNLAHNFKLNKKHILIFSLFPIAFIFESLVFIFYKLHKLGSNLKTMLINAL